MPLQYRASPEFARDVARYLERPLLPEFPPIQIPELRFLGLDQEAQLEMLLSSQQIAQSLLEVRAARRRVKELEMQKWIELRATIPRLDREMYHARVEHYRARVQLWRAEQRSPTEKP